MHWICQSWKRVKLLYSLEFSHQLRAVSGQPKLKPIFSHLNVYDSLCRWILHFVCCEENIKVVGRKEKRKKEDGKRKKGERQKKRKKIWKWKGRKKGGKLGKIGKVGQSLPKTISETIKCDIQTKVMSLLGYIYWYISCFRKYPLW